jgi:hypothetical protein
LRAAAEQRHWSAQVKSAEGAFESAELRAQVAEHELSQLSAIAEELW